MDKERNDPRARMRAVLIGLLADADTNAPPKDVSTDVTGWLSLVFGHMPAIRFLHLANTAKLDVGQLILDAADPEEVAKAKNLDNRVYSPGDLPPAAAFCWDAGCRLSSTCVHLGDCWFGWPVGHGPPAPLLGTLYGPKRTREMMAAMATEPVVAASYQRLLAARQQLEASGESRTSRKSLATYDRARREFEYVLAHGEPRSLTPLPPWTWNRRLKAWHHRQNPKVRRALNWLSLCVAIVLLASAIALPSLYFG